jgi:hypothetical protein
MNYDSISGLKEDVMGNPSGSLNNGNDYYLIVLIWTN